MIFILTLDLTPGNLYNFLIIIIVDGSVTSQFFLKILKTAAGVVFVTSCNCFLITLTQPSPVEGEGAF